MTALKGKTLFITGASRGIGLAIALRAARDGANVAIAAKSDVPNPKLPGTIHSATLDRKFRAAALEHGLEADAPWAMIERTVLLEDEADQLREQFIERSSHNGSCFGDLIRCHDGIKHQHPSFESEQTRHHFPSDAPKADAAAPAPEDPAYQAVRDTFAVIAGSLDEVKWNFTLRDGFLKGSGYVKAAGVVNTPV